MATRKKITKQQAEKVAKMWGFLKTRTGQENGITIKSSVTHIVRIRDTFQNATGFYIVGDGSTGDKMAFAEIHKVYTAALKDKDFSSYVDPQAALNSAETHSTTPVDDKGLLNSKETAQDKDGAK